MFETHDMAFAAYLLSGGHQIHTVRREGRRVFWVFDISDDMLSRAESAWPSAPECKFYSTYQTLKNQIRKV
jgi:hypothetical protein